MSVYDSDLNSVFILMDKLSSDIQYKETVAASEAGEMDTVCQLDMT